MGWGALRELLGAIVAAKALRSWSKLERRHLRGQTVQEGVRAYPQRIHAKTASEHLAPFPIPDQHVNRRPNANGARLPVATGPRRQRMHYRVYAPVGRCLHVDAGEINKMSPQF